VRIAHSEAELVVRPFVAGSGPDDPQLRNRYGVNFRVNDPPLLLGQLQYAWNSKKGDPNLAGQSDVLLIT